MVDQYSVFVGRNVLVSPKTHDMMLHVLHAFEQELAGKLPKLLIPSPMEKANNIQLQTKSEW